jgi:Nucleotide modification associated domain 1
MKRKDLELIAEDIETIFEWLEELHYDVYKLKQGRGRVSSQDIERPGTFNSLIEELYGRDIKFDGSESGIKMTPWDALMDIIEEEGDSCSCDFCGEEDSERNIVIPVIENVDGWEADAWNIYANLYKILVSKQKDYGPDNIRKSPGGPLNGLTVRLYDKLARLNNLLETGATPENESLRDTFLDIANYGVIGMMILDDTFPKSKDN